MTKVLKKRIGCGCEKNGGMSNSMRRGPGRFSIAKGVDSDTTVCRAGVVLIPRIIPFLHYASGGSRDLLLVDVYKCPHAFTTSHCFHDSWLGSFGLSLNTRGRDQPLSSHANPHSRAPVY